MEKRLLKSPGTSQPLKISTGMKENSNFPVYVRPLSLSHLKPFSDLTNSARTFVNIVPRSEKETIVPKQKAMRSLEQDFSTDTCMEGVVKVYLISCTVCLLLFFYCGFFLVNNFSRSEYGDACNHGNWNVTIKPLYIKNDKVKNMNMVVYLLRKQIAKFLIKKKCYILRKLEDFKFSLNLHMCVF